MKNRLMPYDNYQKKLDKKRFLIDYLISNKFLTGVITIIDFKLTEDAGQKLRRYAELLAEANSRARLTGSSDPDVLYKEHISDALVAMPWLPESGSFIDVGTGGGLPGLVWGICRPDLRGTLLDSIGKKCLLLRQIATELGCSNIETVNMRSEDFAKNNREMFDIATARAVAHACILAEYLAPLVKKGGRIITFKGQGAADEIRIPDSKWNQLGLTPPSLHPYSIVGKDRNLLIWEKQTHTPKQYPRTPGMAEKKPWHS